MHTLRPKLCLWLPGGCLRGLPGDCLRGLLRALPGHCVHGPLRGLLRALRGHCLHGPLRGDCLGGLLCGCCLGEVRAHGSCEECLSGRVLYKSSSCDGKCIWLKTTWSR